MLAVKPKISQRLLAVALVFLLMLGILPFAPVENVKVNAASRDTVVSYMRSMATVKWTPKDTITYWSGGSRRFYKGTTYKGMPYTQNNRQNLASFKKYLNSSNVYTGPTGSGSYVGNDCSSAVKFAWKQISSTISFGYTGNMFPGSGTGVLAVGSYSSKASTSSTKTITTKSGSSTMYSAYAQLKPGDAIMARVSGVVNHTRLISSVNVVKNSNGTVNGSSSYVNCIEQCGLSSSRGNTTWNVDKKYTFSTLYSTYYIPITCKELQSASSTSATGASKLAISSYNTPSTLKLGKSFSIYGTITSNYTITSVTVGIYNAKGGEVSAKTVKPNSTYYSIANVDKYIKFGNAKAGTNYYKVVAKDQKTTKTLVNKAYTVTGGSSSGGSSAASTLSISGYNSPTSLAVGKSFSIKGTVTSNYNITSLTVGIYNANGSAVSTKTVKPNAKSYSIAKVDSYIKFGNAKAGTNYYRVKATDAKQTKTLLNKAYTVVSSGSSSPASTLAISKYNYPTSLTVGQSYTIKGSITSNYKITNVTVGIYNSKGSSVSSKSVAPNTKSYSVANVDSYIKFGKAAAGTNYYKITATDTKTKKTLVNVAYTVKAKEVASKLTISNYNCPPTLTQGKSFSIKGTVSSNYNITSLTVGIYNASGKAVSTKTVSPNAKSYSIANVDKYIKFGDAKAGTNYYKVVAKDTKTSKTLINSAFTVKAKEAASTLALSSYNKPDTLKVGGSFSIKGKVTSNYKITSVTVGIYNANGGAVSTKTVKPNSTSFNIATVDANIKFGSAKAGTNYYKIVATDTKQTKTLLNASYKVTSGSSSNGSSASKLSISGHNTPGNLSVGQSFSIKGTVSSNYKITSLTVGIYNSNGGAVSTKTVKPNAKSYSIKNVDSYIKFGSASAGTNYYRIKATDEKQTKTLVNSSYKVTKSSSSNSGLADKIVSIAKAEVGTSGRPNKYTYWYGKVGKTYSYAWCATFVSWCANQAGISTSVIPKSCSCYYMKTGFPSSCIKSPSSYNPVKGDILFFDSSSVDGPYNHVGIVISYNASTGAITTVEGNTSSSSQRNGNTVAIKTRYKNTSGFKVSAFAHPNY